MPTRSRSAASNSSSPRIARSVMAAIWGLRPAMSASSSRHSTLMMVESMSAISSFFAALGCGHQIDVRVLRPRHRPCRRQRRGRIAVKGKIEGMADRQRHRRPSPGARRERLRLRARRRSHSGQSRILWHLCVMISMPCLLQAPPRAASRRRRWRWPKHIGGVIINADSMQVYAEAPILTAQPDAGARARVPHLLYGHVSVRRGLFGGALAP